MPGDGGAAGGPCKNIGVWVAIASNVGWLLILSYIVSMVHSEYSTLSKQQTKLAANIKTLPDEWHDTAHSLEVNQSTLFLKLFELQQSMKNLTDDFLQLRAVVQQQQSLARDLSRVALLEKSLADFGASLKSFSSEMDLLKNRSSKVTESLAEHTQAIEYFRTVVAANETGVIRSDVLGLKNVTQRIEERLDKVNATFFGWSAEEGKKVDELERRRNGTLEGELKSYQEQIKGLSDRLESLEKLKENEKGAGEMQNQVDGFNAAVQRLQGKEGGAAAEKETVGGQQKEEEMGSDNKEEEDAVQPTSGSAAAAATVTAPIM